MHPRVPEPELVSIVIPAYKADRYLSETLKGISRQSWTAWELILVEDGSEGETRKIVARFATEHPNNRVMYINSGQNLGQAHARNCGIDHAQGRFIALLDADDVWLPDHLSSSMDALHQSAADIVYSTAIIFDSDSGEQMGLWGPDFSDPGNLQESLAVRSFITPSTSVIQRELFSRLGGLDESEIFRNVEDYDFWLRAAAAGARFSHVKGVHCRYRKGHYDAATLNLEKLNLKIAQVLEKNIETLQEIEPRTRDGLMARRLFIADLHNIKTDTSYAQAALRRAWLLRRFHPLYLMAFLTSFFPGLLFRIRMLAEPLRKWLVDSQSQKGPIRVVVAGKIPPPVGGQNINISRVLRLLGSTGQMQALYWEWGFTRNWQSRRKLNLRKFLGLFLAVFGLLRLRMGEPIDYILYSTAGPGLFPVLRDLFLLPVSWLFARKLCIYFQAAGIADKQDRLPPPIRWMNKLVHRLSWGAVVITEFGRADPLALGITNIHVLPYGIEDRCTTVRSEKKSENVTTVPTILNIGHLCHDKGTPQLIAACGELRRRAFSFTLQLGGECLAPYSWQELDADIKNAGLGQVSEILGLRQGDQLWDSYAHADLFVFSSIAPYESFGMVLLEAMMMGLPVVVSDWRANADVIGRGQPEGGVITSADQTVPLESRLADAIESALSQRSLWQAWGTRNRERYLREFSIDIYQKRLESYFGVPA